MTGRGHGKRRKKPGNPNQDLFEKREEKRRIDEGDNEKRMEELMKAVRINRTSKEVTMTPS